MDRLFRVNNGGSGTLRQRLDALLRVDGSTVANYQPGVGVVGTTNASRWYNAFGTDIALVLPGVAANTASLATTSVTGNFTIRIDGAQNDYTPAADKTIIDKSSGNDGFIVKWLTTDKIRLVIGDGVGLTNVDVVAASSFTDFSRHSFKIVWEDGVGATFYYDDVQSGSQVAAAKTLTNAAVAFTIGSSTSVGRFYSASLTNSSSTTYYNVDFTGQAKDTSSFTATTGGTVTINQTAVAVPARIGDATDLCQSIGAAQPTINADGSLTFDGIAQYMKSAAFPYVQPESVYLAGTLITWAANRTLFDGNGTNVMLLQTITATPGIAFYAGTAYTTTNNDLTVGAKSIITVAANGASSTTQVNANASVGGGTGTNNAGGFTLGRYGLTAGAFSNIQANEIILRNVADSAAKQGQIIALEAAIHGVAL